LNDLSINNEFQLPQMNKLKIIAIFLISLLLGYLTFANGNTVSENKNEEKNETTVKKISKADFIANIMDFEKNPTQWIYKGKKPCIIDFYADWCGPCRITSPILEELAVEYKDKIDIYKVNIDNEKELSQIFGISGIPAFLYCPMEGKPSMTSGIARDKAQQKQLFIDNIDKLLLKK
jgi:thioredoxin 1